MKFYRGFSPLLKALLLLLTINLPVSAQHWEKRYILSQNQPRAIQFIDTRNGWTVNFAGGVHHTSDGGKNWLIQSSNVIETLHCLSFVDSLYGWAGGDRGVIIHTTDGGRTWIELPSITPSPIVSLQFVNRQMGWLIDGSGNLIHTSNGGTIWETQISAGYILQSNDFSRIKAMAFVDSDQGWALMGEPKRWRDPRADFILSTSDGGKTWNSQESPTKHCLNDIRFADKNHGWAVGDSGTILSTKNGGKDWKVQEHLASFSLGKIYFVDDTYGWIMEKQGQYYSDSKSNRLLATTDRGNTWIPQNDQCATVSLSYVTPTSGWRVAVYQNPQYTGNRNIIEHTNDGGLTWKKQTGGERYEAASVTFIDDNTGWIAGNGNRLFKTTNRGATWSHQFIDNVTIIGDIHFINKNDGWMVALTESQTKQLSGNSLLTTYSGSLYRTHNGGATWQHLLHPNLCDTKTKIAFTDESHGFLLSGDPASCFSTTDGGTTWQPLAMPTSNLIIQFIGVDAKQFWLKDCYNQLCYVSREPGGQLTKTSSTTRSALHSVAFVNDRIGWAVGEQGTILSTNDGGKNWLNNTGYVTSENLEKVVFTSVHHGWAVGASGTVLEYIGK